jgi:hypothetical protein
MIAKGFSPGRLKPFATIKRLFVGLNPEITSVSRRLIFPALWAPFMID